MAEGIRRHTTLRIPWSSRVLSLVLSAAALFLAVCLLTYHPADVPVLSSHPQRPAFNVGGTVGAWLAAFGRGGFGWAAYLLPLVTGLWAWRLWRREAVDLHPTSFAIAGLSLLASAGTLLALFGRSETARADLGGVVGFLLARSGRYYLGTIGTVLAALCVSMLAWVVVSGQTLRATGLGLLRRLGGALDALWRRGRSPAEPATAGPSLRAAVTPQLARPRPAAAEEDEAGDVPAPPGPPRVRVRQPTVTTKPKVLPTPPRRQAPGGFQLPPLDLLTTPPPISERQLSEDLQAVARVLEQTLQEFGLEAKVVNIDRGPTITRYELTPAPGVKINKITGLSDDLALALRAVSCHVVAPIPGKGTVGIDVPNTSTATVYLKEILTAHEFAGNPSPLALPIGKDVSGQPLVIDLRECPHLLIAGATGSGKTVCLNSLLVGIMMHASPDQVKFIMIDPKMVEMALFNDIPHLATPVVTGARKASVALHWAVQEMERRYQLFAKAGVRNLDLYNKRVIVQRPAPKPEAEGGEEAAPEDEGPLPHLVIVVDELADLMMVAAQDVEGAIARLAQLSRAVGIHMILATQRPSVDIITGVIKANFPARIAFQVASKVDSRTILDMNGADKLIGRGDLLFLRPGTAKPVRAQGALVTDAEIERVTAYLKEQREPSYATDLLERQNQPEGLLAGEKDEMYEMAKQLVLDTGQASTSLLQRRLRLGYGRAARILDLMEQEGLVGPPQGSRPREVLVTREHLGKGTAS
jgi:S-DNA-T family DNA segregation ATPase FtsK/SpoIIIE